MFVVFFIRRIISFSLPVATESAESLSDSDDTPSPVPYVKLIFLSSIMFYDTPRLHKTSHALKITYKSPPPRAQNVTTSHQPNPILQMLVRLQGPPSPRVRLAAESSCPIFTEQVIIGIRRYSIICCLHAVDAVNHNAFKRAGWHV